LDVPGIRWTLAGWGGLRTNRQDSRGLSNFARQNVDTINVEADERAIEKQRSATIA
jgi:hypothetical protein